MYRTFVFLLLGTSVLAGEVPGRLSPQDRTALEAVIVPELADSGVRPVAVQKEAPVSANLVQVSKVLPGLSLQPPTLDKSGMLTARPLVVVHRRTDVLVAGAETAKVNPRLDPKLSALDIEHWVAIHHLLGEDEPPNSLYMGNWLGNWRFRLRQRIAQEGYSVEVMQEFERMKEMLAKPPVNRPSGSDPLK